MLYGTTILKLVMKYKNGPYELWYSSENQHQRRSERHAKDYKTFKHYLQVVLAWEVDKEKI